MAMLGLIYQKGQGVAADLNKAVDWYAQGRREERCSVRNMRWPRSISMAPLGDPTGERGRYWLSRAANQGKPEAEHRMGLLAAGSAESRPIGPSAADWFRKAAEQGYTDSQYNLGVLYAEGKGVEKDMIRAGQWFAKAAIKGHPDAALDYGIMVFRGDGVKKDEKTGAQWLLVSARRGNPVAQNRVARLYATGRGFAADPAEAMKWHILAKQGGRSDAWLDEFIARLCRSATRKEGEAQAPAPSSRNPRKALMSTNAALIRHPLPSITLHDDRKHPHRRDHRVDFLRGLALAIDLHQSRAGQFLREVDPQEFRLLRCRRSFVMLAGFASAYAYFARFERGERLGCVAEGLQARRRPLCQPCGDDGRRHRAVLRRRHLFRAARLSRRHHRLHEHQAVDGRSGARLHRPRRRLAISSAISTSCPCIWCCSLMLPIMMWLARAKLGTAARLSRSTLWFLAGCVRSSTCRTIPMPGGWFFNPFAWQLLFVIGFILGQRPREEKPLPFHPWLFWALRRSICSSPIWWVPFDWLINFAGIPLPRTIWGFDKTYVALPRLLHVLALAYVVMMSPSAE